MFQARYEISVLCTAATMPMVEASVSCDFQVGICSGGNSAGTLTATGQSSTSYSYSGTTSSTYDGVGSGSYGDYQSGNWANGSYNLTCLTHSETANAQDTFNLTQVQNYGQTLVGTFVAGSNGTLTGSSGFNGTDSSLTTVTGTFGYAGTETLTLFTAAQASHALYEAGTSSGGCVALGTITFSREKSVSNHLFWPMEKMVTVSRNHYSPSSSVEIQDLPR